ncbi:beta barrel domain-containing protein [Pontibacter beigongshangensis]|uniref:beta barrel domain-containing protein n=1 Tax=Pontibacter beigongshangensis TaxID=2574733 RepID=UPI00164EF171|nr:hypothetical protein [Pontibacter beigongshangensis]
MIDVKVGQTVSVVTYSYFSNGPKEPKETTVEKIGSKYFYLKDFPGHKFSRESGKNISDYGSTLVVYTDIQVYHEEQERNILSDKFRKAVTQSYGRLPYTLEQLRKVAEILNLD